VTKEIEQYKKALGIALDALSVYADPESYHAIAFMADRPAGEFADDFSKDHGHPYYDRPMPGKLARATFKKLAKRYGSLSSYRHR
jgi:hypothetical protein